MPHYHAGMTQRFRIGIIGVSGYGGGEALRLCAQHPGFEVAAVYGESSAGSRVGEHFPALANLRPRIANLEIQPFDPGQCNVDLLFASMPTGKSQSALAAVPEGVKIVDIGGDHRFVQGWTYGLADLWPERVREANRVANPGCYPSAGILALAPLVKAGLVEEGPMIIDAKSGVSGAGRGGGSDFGYSETNESIHHYKALFHGHEPEIKNALREFTPHAGADAPGSTRVDLLDRLAFVPHLVPMTRGILATCYVTGSANANEATMAARAMYGDSPFVRVTAECPRTKWASGSNLAFVHYTADPARRLIVATCAIDNLGKGAAGQAVQNANLMLGLEAAAGLEALPAWP